MRSGPTCRKAAAASAASGCDGSMRRRLGGFRPERQVEVDRRHRHGLRLLRQLEVHAAGRRRRCRDRLGRRPGRQVENEVESGVGRFRRQNVVGSGLRSGRLDRRRFVEGQIERERLGRLRRRRFRRRRRWCGLGLDRRREQIVWQFERQLERRRLGRRLRLRRRRRRHRVGLDRQRGQFVGPFERQLERRRLGRRRRFRRRRGRHGVGLDRRREQICGQLERQVERRRHVLDRCLRRRRSRQVEVGGARQIERQVEQRCDRRRARRRRGVARGLRLRLQRRQLVEFGSEVEPAGIVEARRRGAWRRFRRRLRYRYPGKLRLVRHGTALGIERSARRGHLGDRRRMRRTTGRDFVDPAGQRIERARGVALQRRVDRLLFAELPVEDLLGRPRRFAEGGESDHPRAALERVEGAAQRRQPRQVVGCIGQHAERGARPGDHLGRLFEEDGEHLGVAGELGRQRLAGLGRRRRPGSAAGSRIRWRRRGSGRRLHRLGPGCRETRRTPHQRLQQAARSVVAEQRFRQFRLHAEHVDQEAERAEVAGQPVEQPAPGRIVEGRRRRHQLPHVVVHAQHRLRRIVEAEHRQHAAHRLQLRLHRLEHLSPDRVAEVAVDELLGLGQRNPHLVHHAADGLAVGDAPVQRLHPRFERLDRAAGIDRRDAVGQAQHAVALRRMVEVGVGQRGVEMEQAGRHLHRQLRPRHGGSAAQARDDRLQRTGQRLAGRIEPLQRIADERELLGHRVDALRIAGSERGPRVLGGGDALAAPGRHAPDRSGRARPTHSRPARRRPARRRGRRRRAAASGARRSRRPTASRRTADPAPDVRRRHRRFVRSGGTAAAVARRRACCRRRSAAGRGPAPRTPPRRASTAWPRAAGRPRPARRHRAVRTTGSCARSAAWNAGLPAGAFISASSCSSSRRRAAASGGEAPTAGSPGSSSQRQSTAHRSAGWMRSAPAASCSARYCGNNASGETSWPPSRRPM